MAGTTSRLIKDLNSVPAIVGALGINIAEAQKALNLDYMDNLERLIGLIKSLLAPQAADGTSIDLGENAVLVQDLLKQLAPSRYQFTETTLDVRMDLGQSMDLGASAGFSAGFGAVAVNAGMTVGFGYDYRAAAQITTVLHAIPASSEALLPALLNRAAEISEDALELPAGATIDADTVAKAHSIATKLLDQETTAPKAPVEAEPASGDGG